MDLISLVISCALATAMPIQDHFPDAPENHSVFEALANLRKAGILIIEPQGFGNRPFSRSEITNFIVSTLESSKKKWVTLNDPSKGPSFFTFAAGCGRPLTASEQKSYDYVGAVRWADGFPKAVPSLEHLLTRFGAELKARGINPSAEKKAVNTIAKSMGSLPFGLIRPFPDVPKNHWAAKAIEELREKWLIVGYPGGKFQAPLKSPMPGGGNGNTTTAKAN
jgi:hypothetical protein